MRHDYRLFIPALLAWAATAALIEFPSFAPVASGVSGILFASLWLLIRSTRRVPLAPPRTVTTMLSLIITGSIAIGMFGAIALRVGFEHAQREPIVLAAVAEKGSNVRWYATVTSTPVPVKNAFVRSDQLQFDATVTSVTTESRRHSLFAPVRIRWQQAHAEDVVIGSVIEGVGTFRFSGAHSSLAYSIDASAVKVRHTPTILKRMHEMRATLRESAAQLDGWGSELIPGLAVGDTELVSVELDAAMKTASLSHLTAVSGANCAIITGLVLLAGKALRLRRGVRVVAAVIFLALFVTLVTPEPSVLRAGVMSGVAMIALLTARRGAGLAALSVAIVALLIIDPWQSQHLGFVLSVLATAGILIFTEPITVRLARKMPTWLAITFAVPIAAQIACQPAIIIMQPSLPAFGILANVVTAPAAPIATIVGLAAVVSLPLNAWLGNFLTWLTWFPASWIALVARFFSELPAAQLPWLEGWLGVIVLVVCSSLLLAAVLAKRTLTSSQMLLRWLAGSIALSTLVGIAIVRPLVSVATIPANWRIFVCDVGQGDAILIRGASKTMLIDTGIDPRRVASCLQTAGVQNLDLLVLTHDDKDHAGGLSGISNRVRSAIVSPSTQEQTRQRPAIKPLQAAGVPKFIGSAGLHGSLGDARWQVIAPLAGVTPESTNDASVIVRVDAPEMSALFLGDLGAKAQEALLRKSTLNPVDVVKVSHHGSADQSVRFYNQLKARYGIISVGKDNGYGHPTAETLSMLNAMGTVALRTDEQGSLAIARNTDGSWRLWQSGTVG